MLTLPGPVLRAQAEAAVAVGLVEADREDIKLHFRLMLLGAHTIQPKLRRAMAAGVGVNRGPRPDQSPWEEA